MNRRDFLKASGVALAGGLLLPANLDVINIQMPAPQFSLLTTPELDMDVLVGTRLFGAISGGLLSPLAESVAVNGIDSCVDSTCNALAGIGATDDFSGRLDYLSAMPSALLPLLTHPIYSIQDVESPYSVSGIVAPRSGIVAPSDFAPIDIQPNVGGIVGPYYWRVSLEKHFVGGCIKQNTWHAGALLKYHATNQLIFDLHLCGWWQNGKACFGAYESRSTWCRKYCASNPWQTVFALALAAALMYLSYSAAVAVATAIAAPAFGILVAIPGVPPPP